MQRTHPCPKCGAPLTVCGEATLDDQTLDVFQCDECLVTADFAGEPIESALTFAVDARGRLLDPQSLDPLEL